MKVERREWARVVKEAGQPIYAIIPWGDAWRVVYVGATVTEEIEYPLPRSTVLVARRYAARSGFVAYYVYRVVRGRPQLIATLSSLDGFQPQLHAELSESEKAALEFLAGYVHAREAASVKRCQS